MAPRNRQNHLSKKHSQNPGLPCQSIDEVSAPSIFNKFVGESENNVRKWFDPAREASEKLGDKSPLYVVIVDEIDAILSHRDNNSGTRSKIA